jgi:7-keto-8-aminopelargonate synthetase-like enzyme
MHLKFEIGRDGRTATLPDGRGVVCFTTCGYLGLDRDPRIAHAAPGAAAEAEALLAQVFDGPVVLAGSPALALPSLLGQEDVVLFDRHVHHSVQTTLTSRGSCESLPHADLGALERSIQRAIGGGARHVWYCARAIDGTFGDRLDIAGLIALMQRYEQLQAFLDDTHGTSWCGTRGAGSLIDAELPRERTVIAASLGAGFGCAGGVLVLPAKRRIENLGAPLSPAVLGAICASARIHLSDELPLLQTQLGIRLGFVKKLLRDGVRGALTPVHHVALGEPEAAAARLLDQGFLVTPQPGGIRFRVTRAHTEADLRGLATAIGTLITGAHYGASESRNRSSLSAS